MADPESLTRSISEAVSRAVSKTVSAVFAQVGNQPKTAFIRNYDETHSLLSLIWFKCLIESSGPSKHRHNKLATSGSKCKCNNNSSAKQESTGKILPKIGI